MSAQPNIVFLITDSQANFALSCDGNPYVHTPAADGLARDGVRFERAYCATPSCAPARSAILTGKMDHQIAREDRQIVDAENTVYRLMAQAGYDCVYAGNRAFPLRGDPDLTGYRHLTPKGDAHTADRSVEFIHEWGREYHENPLFLTASFINPHDIYEWVLDLDLRLGPIDEKPIQDCPPLPANYPLGPYTPEAITSYMAANPHFSMPDQTGDPNWWRMYCNAYYRLVELVDAHLGMIVDALKSVDMYEDTLIVMISDHGDCRASHQWMWKNILYEESIGIPLIVKSPNNGDGIVRDATTDALASSGLDLIHTFCEYGGACPPKGLEGRSLKQVVDAAQRGQTHADWRDILPVTTYRHDMGMVGRTLISERFKYIVYEWGRYREQLFDLETDPGEMVNLAVNSEYHERLSDLRAAMRDWCERTDDPFLRFVPVASAGAAP